MPTQRLDPRILRVWYLSDAISIAVTTAVGAAALAIGAALGWPLPVVALAVIAVLVAELADIAIGPRIRYATWRYEVTPAAVQLYRGVFTKRLTVVPLVRVQHVETRQGPLLKSHGLAEVRISTAGESFEIPGLAEDDAARLRDQVAELARLAREDM